MQDGVVGLVGMLHGDGLRKFPQHPLLKVLKPLVVVAAADKLLVLQEEERAAVRPCDTLLPPAPGLQSTASFGWADGEILGETGVQVFTLSTENTFASAPSLTTYCDDTLLLLQVIFFLKKGRAEAKLRIDCLELPLSLLCVPQTSSPCSPAAC